MENTVSPATPRGRTANHLKTDITCTPLTRKPLSQITNIDLKKRQSSILYSSPLSSLSPVCRFHTGSNTLCSPHSLSSGNNVDRILDGNQNVEGDTTEEQSVVDGNINAKYSMVNISPVEQSMGDDKVDNAANGILMKLMPSSSSQDARNILTPVANSTRISEPMPITTKDQCTPKPFIPYNPFEVGIDVLHLPTVSPSLFKEVVSPSDKEETTFTWAIDNLAILRPAAIESPLHDMEIPQDPEYERRAQEAIDKFFSNAVIVPSPWTNSSSRSLNLMSALFSSASPHNLQMVSASPALFSAREDQKESQPPVAIETIQSNTKVSTWSQTELTLPPILPKEVEAALAPFCTFTQEQAYQNMEEADDALGLNNTTLRRKLLFSDEFSAAPGTSNCGNRASSEIEFDKPSAGFSSPASTGPLLDEEEDVLPWGVSMIRPSSRISPRHTLLSPLQSSIERTFTSSPSPLGGKSHGKIFPVTSHEVSPIAYFPPNDLRSLPSPSECLQTPSRRRFLASPKLSPILNFSPKAYLKTPPINNGKTAEVSRSPLGYPRGKRGRNLYLGSNASFSQFESTALINGKDFTSQEPQNIGSTKDYNTNSQGFTCVAEKDASGSQKTPLVRESHRPIFKTSPHFSSSPIKGNGSNSSSCRLDFDKMEEYDGSSKFSDSPPVSPISWKSEVDRYSNDVSLKENGECENEGSKCLPRSHKFRFEDGNRNFQEFGSDEFQENITSMDTECPIYNEGGTLEEGSCGQDTGYQTGTSLQITNQTNQSGSLGSTSLTKELKIDTNIHFTHTKESVDSGVLQDRYIRH